MKAELESAAAGENVLIACHNAAEVESLGEVFADTELCTTRAASSALGRIRAGFHLIDGSHAGHRRSRAVRPRGGPPPGDPAAAREPGHR